MREGDDAELGVVGCPGFPNSPQVFEGEDLLAIATI
jgi:hypothetical protein